MNARNLISVSLSVHCEVFPLLLSEESVLVLDWHARVQKSQTTFDQ